MEDEIYDYDDYIHRTDEYIEETEIQELEPVIFEPTRRDVAWANCRCELSSDYLIPVKIKHESGLVAYPFKCTRCGTSGVIISGGFKEKNEIIDMLYGKDA